MAAAAAAGGGGGDDGLEASGIPTLYMDMDMVVQLYCVHWFEGECFQNLHRDPYAHQDDTRDASRTHC